MPKQTRFQPLEALVPQRIREARLSRGMTTRELADCVGVSRQAISKYELGTAEPSSPIIDKISKYLGFPSSFFYKPPSPPENRGTMFFRSLKTNAVHAKDIMSTKSSWATQIESVLSKDIVFPPVDLPSLPNAYQENTSYTYDEIEDIAMHVRRSWGLGTAPIPNMSRLLESHGVIVATIKTGFAETDACSAYVGKRPFVFLDTQKECAVRTRFNMAHELGHLILHGPISQSDLAQKSILNQVELEANQFASCFLLPKSSFLLDIKSTSLQSFLPLKRKWKVSIQAMVYRCKELEIFSDSQMIYIQKQISAKRWRKNEPYDDEWPCEDASVLRTAIKMLIDRGDYTKDEFLDLFRLPASDVEELCSLPHGYFSAQPQDNLVIIDFVTRKAIK